jgi:hypothetical protein
LLAASGSQLLEHTAGIPEIEIRPGARRIVVERIMT